VLATGEVVNLIQATCTVHSGSQQWKN